MQQTFLTRHKLHEATVRHEALDGSLINLANLGQSHDSFDLGYSGVHRLFVVRCHLYLATALVLVDADYGTGLSLNTLDDLSARANNGTDQVFRDIEACDTRSMRLDVGTRCGHCLQYLIKNVHTRLVCLRESVLQDLVAQSVDLDIHLAGCQTVACTGGLEVHITQVILVAENVTQDSVVRTFVLGDQTHSNTADRFLDRYACVHQRQCAGTYGSHRA